MKVYVTKYALSRGIMVIEAEIDRLGTAGVWAFGPGNTVYRVGKECFTNSDTAQKQARKMAKKRLASLRRQVVSMAPLAVTPKWEDPP